MYGFNILIGMREVAYEEGTYIGSGYTRSVVSQNHTLKIMQSYNLATSEASSSFGILTNRVFSKGFLMGNTLRWLKDASVSKQHLFKTASMIFPIRHILDIMIFKGERSSMKLQHIWQSH